MNQQSPGYDNCYCCQSTMKTTGGVLMFPPSWRVELYMHHWQSIYPTMELSCEARLGHPTTAHITATAAAGGGVSHSQSSIAFRVCFPVSHRPHSKELVIRRLKSFPTNCMIKFLKHCCPFLIPFCQHPFQGKNCCTPWCLIYISF